MTRTFTQPLATADGRPSSGIDMPIRQAYAKVPTIEEGPSSLGSSFSGALA
jgi:hypothetical protein